MNNDEKLTISAAAIGEKFILDAELKLPEYPRYIDEMLMLPNDQSSLLFVGGSGMQVLAGRSARRFIPHLVQHLNGQNSLDDLAAKYPQYPAKVIRDAITLLFSRGLLEDGDSPDIPEDLKPLSEFSGRYMDTTRNNRNRGEVVQRLSNAHVTIANTSTINAQDLKALESAMSNMGIKTVQSVSSPEDIDPQSDLVIMLFIGDDPSASEWMLKANSLNIKALHANVGQEEIEIGPLFVPKQSGCYDCFRHIRPVTTHKTRADGDFWIGVLALNAFHLISRVGQFELYNVCRIHNNDDIGNFYSQTRVARLPGCKTCGLEHTKLTQDSPLIKPWLLHNAAVVVSSYEFRNPKEHQSHYAAANLNISSEEPKPIIGAEIIELPNALDFDALPSWKQSGNEAKNIDINELAVLLRFSVGYQPIGKGLRRVAPSGGGLASSELYIIVRDIEGLDNGFYHYFGYSHVLERLGHIPDQLLTGALGITKSELPQVAIVGITNMNKIRQKYDRFSFRLGSADAGVTQGYLIEMMKTISAKYIEYPNARSKVVAEAINLSVAGNAMYVAFVMGVGLAQDSVREREVDLHHSFYVDNLIDEIDMLGSHTPMYSGVIKTAPDPLTDVEVAPLKDLLLKRRSLRDFSDKPVPLDILTGMVSVALNNNPLRVAHGGLDVDVQLWIAVNIGTEQYQPGIYQFNDGQLELRKQGCTVEQLEPMILQRSLAHAPVVFFLTGNVEDALIKYNARGYHDLIRRAGATMSSLFLIGQGYGVSGCVYGGIYEETWSDVLPIDRYTNCPLLAGSLGYSPDEQ